MSVAEHIARALTLEELADRLRWHSDPAVRELLSKVEQESFDITELEDRIDELEGALDVAEERVNDGQDLLKECKEHIKDKDLLDRMEGYLDG
jgi:peptidoglycan hydrolase CwlO-like protein